MSGGLEGGLASALGTSLSRTKSEEGHTAGQSRPHLIPIREAPERVTEFENLVLVSQFVLAKGVPLQQTSRTEYKVGSSAVVLCDSAYASAFCLGVGGSVELVVAFSKNPPKECPAQAMKTQLLVDSAGTRKTDTMLGRLYGKQQVQVGTSYCRHMYDGCWRCPYLHTSVQGTCLSADI